MDKLLQVTRPSIRVVSPTGISTSRAARSSVDRRSNPSTVVSRRCACGGIVQPLLRRVAIEFARSGERRQKSLCLPRYGPAFNLLKDRRGDQAENADSY